MNSKAYNENGKCIIECSKKYFRPTEVDQLLGDPSKAKKDLNWKPKYNFKKLVKMIVSDLKQVKINA